MRELKTEIHIAASADKVWRILMDFEHWKDWNPIVNQASGAAAEGSKLSITMTGNGGKDGPKYMPAITNFEQPKFFRWRASMLGGLLMTNDKVFELQETNEGTRLIHKELYSGLMPKLFWNKLNNFVPGMLNSMNSALKTLAEKN
ncbi:MAG: SRPBCC domain-containing protein [Gammaproteobacteria bacterium]|nr:SRPBCC domain-containing protein [Gammaproteobacteria bacterium]MDH5729529.1 SRPBCC domain-containing protein [Gammaproteobacteria bacterium]